MQATSIIDQSEAAYLNVTDETDFGVYVHFPFCQRKCPYCDFNSHVRVNGWDEDRLLRAYLSELNHVAQWIGARTVSSIFFGGGTPSLMKPTTVASIIDAITARFSPAKNIEITLEANPGSVEAARFSGYKSAGVNRVSIGVQALNDTDLRALGRIHSADEARAAIELAAQIFDRYSFDLIYARPHQELSSWCKELTQALQLSSDHLSLYQLTIEPDTPFEKRYAAGKLTIPDSESALKLYDATQDIMDAVGMPAYEISNHASQGMESRHNLIYWRYHDYAGIGPGAHGRLSINGTRFATAAEKNPDTWLQLVEKQNHGYREITKLNQRQIADELLLMGLRLRDGIDLDRLAKLGGVRPSQAIIDDLAINHFAKTDDKGARLRTTDKGRSILNEIVYRLSESFEDVGTQAIKPKTPA